MPRTIGFYGFLWQERLRRTVEGVLARAAELGVVVRDFRALQSIEAALERPPPWKGQVDAVIVSLGQTGEPRRSAEWILAGGVPAVSISSDWFDARVPNVRTSFASVGELAARHLLACECRSLLFFGSKFSIASAGRRAAFERALVAAGHAPLRFDTDVRYVGTLEDEAEIRRDKRLIALLRRADKPLGIFALNDNSARAVCLLAAECGWAVPDDVAIVGVDDTSIARLNRPGITSVVTPLEQIGRRAIELASSLLDGQPAPVEPLEIDAQQLSVRESTVGLLSGHEEIQQAREHIRKHACGQLTVADLAQSLAISRKTLEQRFQRVLGCSPGQEIQRVRLKRAEELLRGTQLPISRVGELVGFAETGAFTRFFRRHAGVSPSEFREQQE